jgi:ABC-2 type transport system ATP-binding protein
MDKLSLRAVSFRYSGAADDALRGFSLDIAAGGVFGLLGPNGAGKTTLIGLIAGQLAVASGTMRLDGRPLAEVRREMPRLLGLVPQELAFYPMLSARENLRFFGAVQGLAPARLAERIDAVAAFARLEGVLDRRAAELSGGLKRRLNLAIGLLAEPPIILLDEPTVGVDAQSRAFLIEGIRSLTRPGRIVLYTSHYMEEVQAVCDRVAIMDHGRVLVSGTLDELLRQGAGVMNLTLSAPLPAALAGDWRVRYALCDEGERRYRLQVSEPRQALDALHEASAAGCAPLAIAYGERDLGELFMQLTDRALRD